MSSFVARHFAARALESLEQHLDHLTGTRGSFATETRQLEELLHYLRQAVLFPGPTDGEFLARKGLSSEGCAFPRLPYPVVGLEFSYRLPIELAHPMPLLAPRPPALTDRVCVLAFCPRAGSGILSTELHKSFGEINPESIVVWPIYGYSPASYGPLGVVRERWAPAQTLALIQPRAPSPAGLELSFGRGRKGGLEPFSFAPARPPLPPIEGSPDSSYSASTSQALQVLAGEALSVIELCGVLACENVSVETRLSARRLRHKRIPASPANLFEYRVPVLLPDTQSTNPLAPPPHKYPQALHLKRGRLVSRPNGTSTWMPDAVRFRPLSPQRAPGVDLSCFLETAAARAR